MDIREVLNNLLIMADECKKRGMSVEISVGCASALAYNPYADDEDEDDMNGGDYDTDLSGFYG